MFYYFICHFLWPQRKWRKETLGAVTALAKQFYGSAQSSELGIFRDKWQFGNNLQEEWKFSIYQPANPSDSTLFDNASPRLFALSVVPQTPPVLNNSFI